MLFLFFFFPFISFFCILDFLETEDNDKDNLTAPAGCERLCRTGLDLKIKDPSLLN